ncbi:MAG TPA: 5'-3' exonuclease [Chloroflexota bacterium]|nr:5'-3' exonuclease [Chloroflexota bacterium]
MSPDRPLLLVDGDNLAHRAYHSIPKTLRGSGGQPINSILGWTNMLLGLWEAEQPRAVFVAWDTLGVPTYRHKLWPEYQAGRVFDRELIEQLGQLPELCRAFGFGVGKGPGYEADDYLAAAALAETRRGGTVLILTNDRDAFQLVSEQVTVLWPRKGISDIVRVDAREVVERFGVLPPQVPDYKALAGDSSDNIPGAKGIGPKGAAALLLRHGTLERVLEADEGKLRAQAEQLLAFREMTRLKTDLPIDLPESGPPNWPAAAAKLHELGADALAKRLDDRGQQRLLQRLQQQSGGKAGPPTSEHVSRLGDT